MAEYTVPRRIGALVGDKTTAGGVVTEGSSNNTYHGKGLALNGHKIDCPVCGSIGHIQVVPPRDIEVCDGREIAYGGDLCICGCNPPPRLVTYIDRRYHFSFSDEAYADPAAIPWLIHAGLNPADFALPFDEQFLLQDAKGRPLVDTYYSVKLPDGKVVHGTTNSSGLTERYKTEGAKHIEVYLGHIGVKFTEPLAWGKTNVKSDSFVVAKSDRLAKPWKLSPKGMAFMGQLESGVLNGKFAGYEVIQGMITEVYDDGTGIMTVGLGHRVYPEDKLIKGEKISLERAQEFLRQDLIKFERAANNLVAVPLHQYEYDALISILFNTGIDHGEHDPSPKKRSQIVADCINTGDYKNAPIYLSNFFVHVVKWRRILETKLFSSGIYDANH